MKKMIACMFVLALSFMGCTTMTTIGGVRGVHFPTQREGAQLVVRVQSGSGVDKDAVSVDRVADLPGQASSEEIVKDEMPIPEMVIIVLVISSIVKDFVDSIPISIGPVI